MSENNHHRKGCTLFTVELSNRSFTVVWLRPTLIINQVSQHHRPSVHEAHPHGWPVDNTRRILPLIAAAAVAHFYRVLRREWSGMEYRVARVFVRSLGGSVMGHHGAHAGVCLWSGVGNVFSSGLCRGVGRNHRISNILQRNEVQSLLNRRAARNTHPNSSSCP